ncbi:hypothetical protein KI387_044601, partial [Taxus chinensis]
GDQARLTVTIEWDQARAQAGRRWICSLSADMVDGSPDGPGDEPTTIDTSSATTRDTGERLTEGR